MAARRVALPIVRLATDELHRGPWIYARQVAPSAAADEPEPGALVEVEDASGRFLGHALFNGASDIRLRWLSRGRRTALRRPVDFLTARIKQADDLRRKTLRLPRVTDAYRVAHAEGDDLPGLVIDHLAGTLVCEHHALGFWRLREDVERALERLYPGARVVHRVPRAARKHEGFDLDELESAASDDVEPTVVSERGLAYLVRPGTGHKTGWFCDQRDNRAAVGELAEGRDVLDLFCNFGGFALHAARAGARRVTAVDLDETVLAGAQEAARRNALDVELRHADAFDVLRETVALPEARRPGLVVLDPHKLIAGRAAQETGRRKYLDLNALALEAVRPGGLLATFSCSGALELSAFLGICFQAARRAERGIRVLGLMGAGPDHPQRPDFPRSRYLKGALVAVDH